MSFPHRPLKLETTCHSIDNIMDTTHTSVRRELRFNAHLHTMRLILSA